MGKKLSLGPWGILRYCILLAFVLWSWNFFRSYFLFLALVLMVCCPVVSFMLLWLSRDALQVKAVLPENRVGRSTEFFFDVSVRNPGRVAAFTADITYSWSNIFTGYSEQKKQHLWVPPGGSRISQLLNSRYVGRVETRISYSSRSTTVEKRPSCGLRFSEIYRPLIILIRVTMAARSRRS